MRDVTIKKVMNGFIVGVGCQTLVFENATQLLGTLARYIENPAKVEREYIAEYPADSDQAVLGHTTDGGDYAGIGRATTAREVSERLHNQIMDPRAGSASGGTSRAR